MKATIKPGTVITQIGHDRKGRVWIWPKILGGESTAAMAFDVEKIGVNYRLTREPEFTGDDAILVWEGHIAIGALRFLPEETPASTEASE